MTSIGDYAFSGCSGLTSVTIPESVNSIGSYAFAECSGLTSVIIPEMVNSIGVYAFYQCSGLTSVAIPNSVTSIDNHTFDGCSSLASITIPNSVTRIGDSAFYGTAWYDNQPDGLVYAGKVAYKYKGTMPEGIVTVIEEGTLGIAEMAFYNCSSLTSITIPNSMTSIGDDAFKGCYNLTSVTFKCPSIESWFSNNTFISEIILCDDVTSIGDRAFSGCSGLTSVTIPNSVTSIGDRAFSGCSGLTSVTIPNNVTSIGYYVFSGCSSMTSIIVEDGNAVYDSRNNCNAIIETGSNTLKCGCLSTIIPESVTIIDYGAFEGCTSLTSVSIPKGVTSIGSYAFSGCSSLTDVYCLAEEIPKTFGRTTFNGVPVKSATLHVPAASIEAYRKHLAWNIFGTIVAIQEIDIDPMETETEIAFDDAIGDETDLSGAVVENMYITLNQEGGDIYSEEEGCLVIANTVTEAQVETLLENGMDAQEVQENFNGIILEVPAGRGVISVTAQTGDGRALSVKIGDNDAHQFVQTAQGNIFISYEVDTPQYVYIYGTDTATPSSRRHAQGTEGNVVKIYSVRWTPDDATSISTAAQGTGLTTVRQAFTLDGKATATPQKQGSTYVKGINIVRYSDGTTRKVLVK